MDLLSLIRTLRCKLRKAIKKCNFAYGHMLEYVVENRVIIVADHIHRPIARIEAHAIRAVFGAVTLDDWDNIYESWILVESDDDIYPMFMPCRSRELMELMYSLPGFRKGLYMAFESENAKTVFPTKLWP